MRRLVVLGSLAVLGLFVVFVARETREVVLLAAAIDARLGWAVLVALLLVYAAGLGVPLVMLLRLPRPLRPPASEEDPAFARHLARLAQRLARNPHLTGRAFAAGDRAAIERSLGVLHDRARQEMAATAAAVFLSTAVSQSGRLDGLAVLIAQGRMVWRIAHLYAQRPAPRELLALYANVAVAAFVADSVDDLDLQEIVEPVLAPVVAGSAVGAIPGASGIATFVMDSVLEGSFNAFLTLRVGCLASRYCAALTVPDRRALRRSATAEAASILPGVVAAGAGRVSAAVWGAARRSTVAARATTLAGAVKRATGSVAATVADAAAWPGRRRGRGFDAVRASAAAAPEPPPRPADPG